MLVCLVFAAAFLHVPVSATDITASGACGDDLTWTLTSDGTLTIDGNGAMWNWAKGYAPWYSNRLDIKIVLINNFNATMNFKWIDDNAFYNCTSIAQIQVKNNLCCSSDEYGVLYEMIFIAVEGVYGEPDAIYKNDNIGLIQYPVGNDRISYIVPDSIKVIYDNAFYKCNALRKITIGKNTTDIGKNSFAYCSNLSNVIFEGDAPTAFGSADEPVFIGAASDFTIYYYSDAVGFTEGTWDAPDGQTYRTIMLDRETNFESGTGTEDDPYIIKTAGHLKLLEKLVNTGVMDTDGILYSRKAYKLGSDITINTADIFKYDSEGYIIGIADGQIADLWFPIGNASEYIKIPKIITDESSYNLIKTQYTKFGELYYLDNGAFKYTSKYISTCSEYYFQPYFSGVFDGDGHTIYGIYINNENEDQGLFGTTEYVKINNLCVSGGYIKGGKNTGGICGGNCYAVLKNCINENTVIGDRQVGGIVGSQGSGSIWNSSNRGKINGNSNVGGIAGVHTVIYYIPSINYCYNTAPVSGELYIGGIAGSCDGNILNSYNTGSIYAYSSDEAYSGGIVGRFISYYGNINITRCYNIGVVSAAGTYSGGIAGAVTTSSTSSVSAAVENCYYLDTSTQTGTTVIDGVGTVTVNNVLSLTDAQLRLSESYTGFDFDTIWIIDAASTYPYAELSETKHVGGTEPSQLDENNLDDQGIYYTLYQDTLTAMVGGGEKELSGYNTAGEPIFRYKDNNSQYDGANDGVVLLPEKVSKDNQIYTVTSVCIQAFSNCASLKSITISAAVTDLFAEKSTFVYYTEALNNNSLTDIIVYDTNPYYSSSDGVLFNKDKTTLLEYPCGNPRKNYIIPDGTVTISQKAFVNCKNLTDISIPASVVDIGNSGDDVTYRFSSLTQLKTLNSITVDEDNQFYSCDERGVLFNKDKTTLLVYPRMNSATTYVMPDSVTRVEWYSFDGASNLTELTISPNCVKILPYAFTGCSGLTNIVIPDGVILVSNAAFTNCSSLTSIVLPDSVTSLGGFVFAGCSSLTSIVISDSLTEIYVGTFFGCSSLTSVTIPERVTSIGKNAFTNCSNLISVTFPGNLKSIEEYAFMACSSLTSVTIPESVTSLGNNAFHNCGSLKSAYLMGNAPTCGQSAFTYAGTNFKIYYIDGKNGWTSPTWTSSGGDTYNTDTFEPDKVGVLISDEIVSREIYRITVTDIENGEPIVGASVTLGEVTHITAEDGSATFEKPLIETVALKIIKDNYQTQLIDNYRVGLSNDNIQLVSSAVKSTLKPKTCNEKSIITGTAQINNQADLYAEIEVEGSAQSGIKSIKLVQNICVIAESNDGIFRVHNSKFFKGVPVVAVMYTNDGKIVSLTLNITVVSFTFIEFNLPLQGTSVKVPSDVSVFGGMEFKFGFSKPEISFEITNYEYKVGINVDVIDEDLSKIDKTKREQLEKLQQKTPSSSLTYNAGGYIVFEVGNNGIQKTTAQIFMSIKYKNGVGKTIPIQVAVITIPLRVDVEFSAEAQRTITMIGYDFDNAKWVFPSIDWSIELKISAYGGIGVSFASAGIYGHLGAEFKLAVLPQFYAKSLIAKGELGVYAKARIGFWRMEVKLPLVKGQLVLYDNTRLSSYDEPNLSIYEEDAYELDEREYLAGRSEWQGSAGIMQTSVYDGADPQIVKAGDTIMMMYLDDNGGNDSYNFQRLVYSVWDGTAWSTPVPVDDNNYNDADFKLYSDGTDIWVAYTEADRLFTADDEIADYVSEMEIVAARYADGSFSEKFTLTDDKIYDMQPSICVIDNIPTVAWVKNASNDFLGITNDNTIYISEYKNEAWTTKALSAGMNAITSLDIGALEGSTAIVVSCDGDNDLETYDDVNIIVIKSDGTAYTYEAGINGKVSFNGASAVWYHDGSLYAISAFDAEPTVLLDDVTEKYNITGNLIMFTVKNDEGESGGSDVYCSVDGKPPVRLTNTDGYVDAFDAVFLDGSLLIVYRNTSVEFTDDSFNMSSELCCNINGIDSCDLTLNDVAYDYDDLISGGTVTLTAYVANNGFSDIESVNVSVGDYSENVTIEMTSGETGEVRFEYPLPEDLSSPQTVMVILDGDGDLSDNSYDITLGYADFVVNSEQRVVGGKNYVAVTVSNTGNITGTGTFTVTGQEKQTIVLEAGSVYNAMYSGYTGTVSSTVVSETPEFNTYDNEAVTVVENFGSKFDINGDRIVDIIDLNVLQLYLSVGESLSDSAMAAADCNSDGKIDSSDIEFLTAYILNKNG